MDEHGIISPFEKVPPFSHIVYFLGLLSIAPHFIHFCWAATGVVRRVKAILPYTMFLNKFSINFGYYYEVVLMGQRYKYNAVWN